MNENQVVKLISGGETIVKESGVPEVSGSMYDESFVDIDFDNDAISNEQMQRWMDRI